VKQQHTSTATSILTNKWTNRSQSAQRLSGRNVFLDFKLPPCCECRILSFGWFTGIWILCADVSEHYVCSIFIGCVNKNNLDISLHQYLWNPSVRGQPGRHWVPCATPLRMYISMSSFELQKITGGKYVVLCYGPAQMEGFCTKIRQTNVKLRKVYRSHFLFSTSYSSSASLGWGGEGETALTRFRNRKLSVQLAKDQRSGDIQFGDQCFWQPNYVINTTNLIHTSLSLSLYWGSKSPPVFPNPETNPHLQLHTTLTKAVFV
jgi:hypothetical protein